MRFLMRGLVGACLVLATLGVLLAAGLTIRGALQRKVAEGARPDQVAEERVYSAQVKRVEAGAVVPRLTAYGQVTASRSLALRAPAAGRVIWVAANLVDGRAVGAGERLLQLDPVDAISARDQAAGDLATSKAEGEAAVRALGIAKDELANAEAQAGLRAQALTRQKDLAGKGVGSDAAVETAALAAASSDQAVLSQRQAASQAETAVALAEAAVTRAEIALADAERAVADTELVAEFAGVLDGVTISVGAKLSAGEALGNLIDPAALNVEFRVSTAQFGAMADAGGVVLPLKVEAMLAMGGESLTARGQVDRVGALVGAGQTGRLVHAGLTGGQGLQPGDFVTVTVALPELAQAVVLPASALGGAGDVLVLGADDRLESVPVQVLHRQGDEVILSASGIAGRDVVLVRSPLLGAGIKVRAVREGAGGQEFAALTAERRAALMAQVKADATLTEADRARLVQLLERDEVPAEVLRDLDARAGG